MKAVTSKMEAQILELQADVESNKKAINENGKKTTSYAATVRSPVMQASNGPAVRTNQPAGGTSQNGPAASTSHEPTQNAENSRSDNSSEFQTVGRNGGKRPNKATGSGKPRPKQGKADTHNTLQAGPTKIFVQITNVRQHVTENDLSAYISEKTDGNYSEISIKDTSSEGWSTKRFVIEFDAEHMNEVLGEDFWPGKIYFKRWFPERKRDKTINGFNNDQL